MLIFTCLTGFWMTGSTAAWAQQVTARTRLDTSNILIGQQVALTLEVSAPRNLKLSWPVFTDSLASMVEIVESGKLDTLDSKDANMLHLSQQLKITSFDTGTHQIPPIPIYELGKEDSSHLLAATSALFLRVNTVAVDTTKAIKDIKGIMSIPMSFWEKYFWYLISAAALLLLALVWFIVRKITKKEPVFARMVKPVLPAHLKAMEELEKLRNAKVWQSGRIKEYHTRLTDILREYLGGRFYFTAMEMTTDEILQTLEKEGVSYQALTMLQEILQLADLVKFAKEMPLPTEHDLSLNRAVEFVNLTRPMSQVFSSAPDSEPSVEPQNDKA